MNPQLGGRKSCISIGGYYHCPQSICVSKIARTVGKLDQPHLLEGFTIARDVYAIVTHVKYTAECPSFEVIEEVCLV
jgi:hypothetical protein